MQFNEADFIKIEALQKEARKRDEWACADLCERALRGNDDAWADCLCILAAKAKGINIWIRR